MRILVGLRRRLSYGPLAHRLRFRVRVPLALSTLISDLFVVYLLMGPVSDGGTAWTVHGGF
jgi:hypothetical protein